MVKTGKWLELCRRACVEKEPLRMIEQEHAPVKKQSGSQSENENASGPPAHNT